VSPLRRFTIVHPVGLDICKCWRGLAPNIQLSWSSSWPRDLSASGCWFAYFVWSGCWSRQREASIDYDAFDIVMDVG